MNTRRQWLAAGMFGLLPQSLWAQAVMRDVLGLGKPTVALILPPAGNFGWAAQALRAGFAAGINREQPNFAVQVIEAEDRASDMAGLFQELQSRGFSLVVGPLTRNGVNAVIDANVAPIVTLALNQPDADRRLSGYLLPFGLQIESDAQQVGRLAFDDASVRIPQRRPLKAVAVQAGTPLAKRASAAFVDTWRELGGDAPLPIDIENRAGSELKAVIASEEPDVVFVAASPEQLRNLRGLIERQWMLYGTSLSSVIGSTNRSLPEFEGARIVEMPFLAQPDNAAMNTFGRPPANFNIEQQRLYALGVDAYRVTVGLMKGLRRFEIDGMTGRLNVNLDLARIDRLSAVMQYRNGALTLLEAR